MSRTSVDDRELLWQAWPDGYLAMRGVQSIAGWQCLRVATDNSHSHWVRPGPPVGVNPWSAVKFLHGQPPHERRISIRSVDAYIDPVYPEADLGGMLPNVDIADTATWGCLMQDLVAAASGVDVFDGVHATLRPLVDTTWGLEWRTTSGIYGTMQLELNETPLSLPRALVLARIQLRNKAAEASSRKTP